MADAQPQASRAKQVTALRGPSASLPDCLIQLSMIASQRVSKNTRHHRATCGKTTANHGIWIRRKWFKGYMASLGFTWHPTMQIGSGCKTHLRADELPKGRLVVALSHHMAAVVDGVLYDTYDCSRDGSRCVYGYYKLEGS